MIGSSLDKHLKDVEAIKVSHSRLEKESAQRDRGHATLAERLRDLEQLLGGSVDKHVEEVHASQIRIDQLHGRMSACEALSGAIEMLKKSHGVLTSDKASRDAQHASLTEDLDYIKDFLDKQGREVAAMSSKVEQVGLRLSACERS